MNTKTIKSIAKNTAKVALSVAVPPLGLAVSFPKDKGLGLTIGVIASAFIGLVIIAQKSSPHKIYDSPGIYQYERHNNFGRAFVELFTSPAALYFDNHKETIIQTADKELYDSGSIYTAAQLNGARVYGHDVITFNDREGIYNLNFEGDRKFVTSKGDAVSLDEVLASQTVELTKSERAIEGLKGKLDALISQGNLLEARIKRGELESEEASYAARSDELRSDYESLVREHKSIKSTYNDAVTKMNSELDGLKNPAKVGESK